MDLPFPEKIAFVDLETTGGSPTQGRIIEIGIIRVENGEIVATYDKLINPESNVPTFIQEMTGIGEEELFLAPTFSQVRDEVLDLLEDCVFVAHNVRFDYGFLKHEFKREGILFKRPHFCTAKLSKYLFPDFSKHNLDSIIDRFGIVCENRHRAFGDAKVLWDFFKILNTQVSTEILKEAISFVSRSPSRPMFIPEEEIDSLPECAGVYIFYGENGMPLYVGMSQNIRDRVLSHFANDHLSTREMKLAQQTHHIEVIKTAGRIGAELRELHLIRKLQPMYNRMLRNCKRLVVLKKYITRDGYYALETKESEAMDPNEIEDIVGVFKTKNRAMDTIYELAGKYNLCFKLLGIEKTENECFYYHLKQCKGACIGKELPAAYNIRFVQAFSKIKMQQWPFEGEIVFREENEVEGLYEDFYVNKWMISKSDSNCGSENGVECKVFDYDIYSVLKRKLLGKNGTVNVKKVVSE
jgi:DNA polymerase-3 subunit epsilon